MHHGHYVADGDFNRKVGDTWQSWDHERGEWFTSPSMVVKVIEREMAR